MAIPMTCAGPRCRKLLARSLPWGSFLSSLLSLQNHLPFPDCHRLGVTSRSTISQERVGSDLERLFFYIADGGGFSHSAEMLGLQ